MSTKSADTRSASKRDLTEQERMAAILLFRSGGWEVKDICAKFGLSSQRLKKIVTDAGYGY